jgi:hypothetical protein
MSSQCCYFADSRFIRLNHYNMILGWPTIHVAVWQIITILIAIVILQVRRLKEIKFLHIGPEPLLIFYGEKVVVAHEMRFRGTPPAFRASTRVRSASPATIFVVTVTSCRQKTEGSAASVDELDDPAALLEPSPLIA